MHQGVLVLATLPKDLGSILSSHMASYKHLRLQFQGTQNPLLASVGIRHAHCTQIRMQIEHSYT